MTCVLRILPVFCTCLAIASEQEKVNPGAQNVADFSQRVADYLKVRRGAISHVASLKPTKSPDAITRHEHALAHEIREARRGVGQGNIFTPAITQEFRRLLAATMQGPEAVRIRSSLRHAEPIQHRPVRVNDIYPHGTPLQSVPPSLLLNLPPLPSELEYRFIGNDLILRDVEANLIVDLIPNALS